MPYEITTDTCLGLLGGQPVLIGPVPVLAVTYETGSTIHLVLQERFREQHGFVEHSYFDRGRCHECHEERCDHTRWTRSPQCHQQGSALHKLDAGTVDTLRNHVVGGFGHLHQRAEPLTDPELAWLVCRRCIESVERIANVEPCEHGLLSCRPCQTATFARQKQARRAAVRSVQAVLGERNPRQFRAADIDATIDPTPAIRTIREAVDAGVSFTEIASKLDMHCATLHSLTRGEFRQLANA